MKLGRGSLLISFGLILLTTRLLLGVFVGSCGSPNTSCYAPWGVATSFQSLVTAGGGAFAVAIGLWRRLRGPRPPAPVDYHPRKGPRPTGAPVQEEPAIE
jgi:hypothetical protein